MQRVQAFAWLLTAAAGFSVAASPVKAQRFDPVAAGRAIGQSAAANWCSGEAIKPAVVTAMASYVADTNPPSGALSDAAMLEMGGEIVLAGLGYVFCNCPDRAASVFRALGGDLERLAGQLDVDINKALGN